MTLSSTVPRWLRLRHLLMKELTMTLREIAGVEGNGEADMRRRRRGCLCEGRQVQVEVVQGLPRKEKKKA